MELHHLRTFVVVADEGSVTKAAQRLYLTPPTVSGHIKALEETLAVTLFVRTAAGMQLTEKGELLKAKAEQTLLAAQDLVNHATEMQAFLIGELRVGLNATAGYLQVAQLVADLETHFPGITLNFESSASGRILLGLQNQALDAGFIFGDARAPEIAIHYLKTVDLVAAIPAKRFATLTDPDWAAVAQLPWICSDDYCPFQAITDDLFGQHGLTIEHKIVTNDETTKLDLVRQGVGAALLLAEESAEAVAKQEIVVWPTELLQSDLNFAYRADRVTEPLLNSLIETVLGLWQSK